LKREKLKRDPTLLLFGREEKVSRERQNMWDPTLFRVFPLERRNTREMQLTFPIISSQCVIKDNKKHE